MDDHRTELGDFRVTRTADGLRIEVLDYHAGSLLLTREALERLGYLPAEDVRPAERRRGRRRPPQAEAPES